MSDARNVGETAFGGVRGQPSAEIVRVECVKCMLCHWALECTIIFVFANVSYETLILGGLFVSFCECLIRNGHFGRSSSLSVLANVSYKTLILEGLLVGFCECLVRNAHFGSFPCPFLRMSRTKRSVWKTFGRFSCQFSYEMLILEGLFVSFCECLVRNAHFGRFLCLFLRVSRTKRSFWKISLSFFANVSYETLFLEGFIVRFCECLVRNAHFGRFS